MDDNASDGDVSGAYVTQADDALVRRSTFSGNACVNGASDPDADGLPTATEFALGTSPTLEDTDDDGVPDDVEVTMGTNPLSPYDP